MEAGRARAPNYVEAASRRSCAASSRGFGPRRGGPAFGGLVFPVLLCVGVGRVALDALRRRAEHNDGSLHTLEEVALHQQNIERLELVQEACPRLKILLLHDNVISKMGASTMDASRSKLVVD